MLTTIKWIFYAELLLLLRRSQEWLYPLGFFIMVLTIFPIAFATDPVLLQKMLPGAIWIAALLASLLSIEHVFFTEIEDGYLEQLIILPIPLALIVLIKLCAQWLLTQLPLILLLPVIGVIFHLPKETIFVLCVSLTLGTPILILIGSLGAALTLGLRQQGVLLSLLILPLATPVLIFGVNIVQQFAAGFSILGPLAFLTGLSLLSLTLAPFAIAAALRVSVDD